MPKLTKSVIKAFNKRSNSFSMTKLHQSNNEHNNSLNNSTENLIKNYKSQLREKPLAEKTSGRKLNHNESTISGPYSTLNDESMNKSTISLNGNK